MLDRLTAFFQHEENATVHTLPGQRPRAQPGTAEHKLARKLQKVSATGLRKQG